MAGGSRSLDIGKGWCFARRVLLDIIRRQLLQPHTGHRALLVDIALKTATSARQQAACPARSSPAPRRPGSSDRNAYCCRRRQPGAPRRGPARKRERFRLRPRVRRRLKRSVATECCVWRDQRRVRVRVNWRTPCPTSRSRRGTANDDVVPGRHGARRAVRLVARGHAGCAARARRSVTRMDARQLRRDALRAGAVVR